jgi:phage baseplate assembly protein V
VNKDLEIAELQRKTANLIMAGTIAEVDAGKARAKVKIGGLLTAPLPWLSPRMGSRRDWNPPKTGEQVLVVCHNGDPAQGFIVASIGSSANPNPSANPRIFKTVFDDGTFVQIDLDTHEMSVGCAGDISVTADGKVKVVTAKSAEVQAVGNIKVDSLASIKATAAMSAEVAAPVIKLTGAVEIIGTLSVSGLTALQAATVMGTELAPGNDRF